MKVIPALLALGYFISVSSLALAHPGGIDEKGGHRDNATGTYHYHRDKNGRQLEKPVLGQEAVESAPKDEPALEAPVKEPAKVKAEKKGKKGKAGKKGKKGKSSKPSKKKSKKK